MSFFFIVKKRVEFRLVGLLSQIGLCIFNFRRLCISFTISGLHDSA